jgi:lipoprotein-anchoring transpeptidase ErfK/SrfK
MTPRLSRRHFLAGSLALTACPPLAMAQESDPYIEFQDGVRGSADPQLGPGMMATEEEYFDPALLPPAESPIDFPIEPVSTRLIKRKYRRQMVEFEGSEDPGTLVVDPDNRFLYHVLAYGVAKRYGVGVGRAGFAWAGDARIGMKRRWPRWVPPREMVDRDERARKWVNGQPGGPENPLGARALYLYSGGKDTLYRIHGTNEPKSIGLAMSSGCIRMLNEDVAELFDNVIVGTPVIVRSSQGA